MTERSDVGEKFVKLVEIMERLRAPGGCPWDIEQDYLSLRRYILEEAYELIEAIEGEDPGNRREECGDLLLQVLFVSSIAKELGEYDISGVIETLSEKLVRRHPHVFGETEVSGSEEVLKNWEQIKVGERKEKKADSSLLAGIPRGLPSLLRSYRMQERAAKAGFDWPKGDLSPVLDKVREELAELVLNIDSRADPKDVEEELGDLLFASVNLSRHLGFDPEAALHKACEKFSSRFRYVENEVSASARSWKEYTLEELDRLWELAKIS